MKKLMTILFLFAFVFVDAQIKVTNSNGNWNNPSIWTPNGVPASGDKIYIDHDVILNQNFTANDTIFVRGILGFSKNRTLNVSSGYMVLVNDSIYDGRIGNMANNTNIIGNFNFQKWIERCDAWNAYGSPFDAVLLSDLSFLHTGFSGCPWYPTYTWINTLYYDESVSGNRDFGWYSPTSLSSALQRGRGFFYWYANSPSIAQYDFPRKVSLDGSINFNTNFDYGISRTNSGNFFDDGWNLISNPYPGTIDWESNGWNRRNVLNAIWTWDGCNGLYTAYAAGVSVNGGSRYISSMQGFWVFGYFSNARLRSDQTVLADDAASLWDVQLDNVLKVSLGNDEIAVRLDENSTGSMDTLFDAVSFLTDSSRLYSIVSGNPGTRYAINTVSDSNVIIPLYNKGSGIVSFNGTPTFDDHDIYLFDISANQKYLVTDNFTYHLKDVDTLEYSNTLELHFIRNNLTDIKDNYELIDGSVWYDVNNIFVNISGNYTIELYDLSGRLMYDNNCSEKMTVNRPDNPAIMVISKSNERIIKKIF